MLKPKGETLLMVWFIAAHTPTCVSTVFLGWVFFGAFPSGIGDEVSVQVVFGGLLLIAAVSPSVQSSSRC